MKELSVYILTVFIGLSAMICAISYYETSESAQKIENIKTLYELKTNLQSNKSSKEIDEMMKEIEQKIDSLENK